MLDDEFRYILRSNNELYRVFSRNGTNTFLDRKNHIKQPMQYQTITVKLNGNTYTGNVTRKPAPFVPGKQNVEYHYMFVFDNWQDKGSGILVIHQENGKWVPHTSGTIQDKDLAQAAGEAIKKFI